MNHRLTFLTSLFLLSLMAVPCFAESQGASPTILSVERIWDTAPHNAFTDLIRYQDKWVCAFREAPEHKGGVKDSYMRVLVSKDGKAWESAASLVRPARRHPRREDGDPPRWSPCPAHRDAAFRPVEADAPVDRLLHARPQDVGRSGRRRRAELLDVGHQVPRRHRLQHRLRHGQRAAVRAAVQDAPMA